MEVIGGSFPDRRKYSCEIHVDTTFIKETHYSKKSNQVEWGETIKGSILENSKFLRITIHTKINYFTTTSTKVVGELKIPVSTLFNLKDEDKIYPIVSDKKGKKRFRKHHPNIKSSIRKEKKENQ